MVPALAVSVTTCAVGTDETAAVNPTLVEPAATDAEVGTETDARLLANPTVNPPLAAAAFSVIVQASVPAPVIVEFEQVSELSTGMPVPLKPITVEAPVVELLATVNCPVAEPANDGLN
jgi:hypothetical protein